MQMTERKCVSEVIDTIVRVCNERWAIMLEQLFTSSIGGINTSLQWWLNTDDKTDWKNFIIAMVGLELLSAEVRFDSERAKRITEFSKEYLQSEYGWKDAGEKIDKITHPDAVSLLPITILNDCRHPPGAIAHWLLEELIRNDWSGGTFQMEGMNYQSVSPLAHTTVINALILLVEQGQWKLYAETVELVEGVFPPGWSLDPEQFPHLVRFDNYRMRIEQSVMSLLRNKLVETPTQALINLEVDFAMMNG